MSAKKQSATTTSWTTCSMCQARFHNRGFHQKHVDLGCGPILPCIDSSGHGLFESALLPDTLCNKELPTLRNSHNFLFINCNYLVELKMKTLDWVLIHEQEKERMLPLAFQVWAIQGGTSPIKAYFNSKAKSAHPMLCSAEKGTYIIRSMDHLPRPLQSITFQIISPKSNWKEDDFKEKIRRWTEGRPLFVTNSFVIQYLTYHIQAVVESSSAETGNSGYVTKETDISCSYSHPHQQVDALREESRRKITLDMVGGLDAEAKEIIDTIQHVLNVGDDKSSKLFSEIKDGCNGILVFGQHGTGKSMLVNAVCTHLRLNKFFVDIAKSSSLRQVFEMATQSKGNSAVVVENLDVLSSLKREWTENMSIVSDLRSEMESMSNGIIVIATATNPDLISPSLRLPHVFGKEVELPIPTEKDRFQILERILHHHQIQLSKEEVENIALSTHGFVGADLEALRATASRLGNGSPSASHFKEALKFTTPSAMKSIQLEIPHVRWDDIGGLEDLKFNLKQSIEWPRTHPEAFQRMGLTPPKGILMYGPPGCSKTMIAKALATESGLNFLSVKGSDLFSKWVGESEKSVQNLFRKARQVAPAILFFDELDALGCERGQQGGGSNVHERVLAQLLVEIDGIEPLNDVTIVAATNRPDLIDAALTRPGRLDRIIYVPLPDAQTRCEILRIKSRKMPLSPDVSIEDLVEKTEGYSGAEITGICQEAGLKALEEDLRTTQVRMAHFLAALEKCPRRIQGDSLAFYAEYSKAR